MNDDVIEKKRTSSKEKRFSILSLLIDKHDSAT